MAMKYYLKAANQDNYRAQLAVARMYKNSDVNQAIYWYNIAMVKSYDDACLGLVDIYLKDNLVDENQIRMMLDNIEDKESTIYLEMEEKYRKYIEERTAI